MQLILLKCPERVCLFIFLVLVTTHGGQPFSTKSNNRFRESNFRINRQIRNQIKRNQVIKESSK